MPDFKNYLDSANLDYVHKRLGSPEQLGGVLPFTFDSGRAKGVKALDVRNGGGLRFTVVPDRCMDIAFAEYKGIPIGWICKNGVVGPEYFENGGIDFLRTFSGGLTTTCGLTQAGSPGREGDEILGIHGRISHMPAESYSYETGWDEKGLKIEIKGVIRETCLYAENMVLYRTISCSMGDANIIIKDRIVNEGYNETPFMLIYHNNFGFPIVSEHSRLVTDAVSVEPWNDDAKKGDGRYAEFINPEPGYQYQCFLHIMDTSRDTVRVAVVNDKLKFGAYVKYSPKQLPCFTEWKMMGAQDYVIGFEPGNCIPEGRVTARENGRLTYLKPGESHDVEYEIGILEEGVV